MAAGDKDQEAVAADLGDLLDAGQGAMVTLVAGDTRLVAHKAVLAARSHVFEAMFQHDTLEASSGEVVIPDVEGAVLRQLLVYMYTLQVPQLLGMALQLLPAADKYCLLSLKAACEQQLVAQLSVETAAATAVLAVRHACTSLRQAAIAFIKANTLLVITTKEWADAMRTCTEELVEVTRLLNEPPSDTRITMAASCVVKETVPVSLGVLLDARDGVVVTLLANETRLAAHKAVLAARSPVFAAMLCHDTQETSSGVVTIPDVEGPVLRQLLEYCYTLQAPQLPGMATKLLMAADKYGLLPLKALCEQQLVEQLSVETAATAAVLAVRHSCNSLRQAAVAFIRTHFANVMGTQGWADAVCSHPKDVVEISQLLAEPPAETRSLFAEQRGRRLIEAAKEGAVGDVETLLAAGADVKAMDGGMDTALHYAAARGHVEVARCLLGAGAEVDARDDVQATPLFGAAYKGHEAVAQLLLAASADPNARHRNRCTPLHAAARFGHTAVVRLLLASSAHVEARNKYGWSPLHWAAYNGHREVAAVLLEAGADMGARDNDGETPLDLARQQNRQQLIDLLT